MRLTDRQEKFVQLLISGKSQREAYKIAYPRSQKWKPNSIDRQASVIFNRPKVLQRYTQLKKEREEAYKEASVWDMIEAANKLKWLLSEASADIADRGVKQANASAFISAIKELNDMLGIKDKQGRDKHDDGFIEALNERADEIWQE